MSDLLVVLLVVAAWAVLQFVIFPKLGVPT